MSVLLKRIAYLSLGFLAVCAVANHANACDYNAGVLQVVAPQCYSAAQSSYVLQQQAVYVPTPQLQYRAQQFSSSNYVYNDAQLLALQQQQRETFKLQAFLAAQRAKSLRFEAVKSRGQVLKSKTVIRPVRRGLIRAVLGR